MSQLAGPLDGITIVEAAYYYATPFATALLAELGARIIKIERPGVGDPARAYDQRVLGQSSHFVWTNRSKESITLDLKQAEAIRIVHRLLEGADVRLIVASEQGNGKAGEGFHA